jgi:type IV pilus assembly protein PilC
MPFLSPDNKIKPEDASDKNASKKTWTDKANNFLESISSVPVKEKLIFIQNLSVMIRSGITILAAFRTLAEQTENKTFAKIIKQVAVKLEQGSSLSDSLKPYPKVFNELFVNMVSSGEVSGKLEDVLNQLYLQTKKQYELTSRIKGALIYPIVVVVAMIGIGFFMMIFVIPNITSVFVESGVALPLSTRILIAMSNFITKNIVLCITSIVAIVAIIWKFMTTKQGKYIFQAITLRLPIIGPIIKKVNLARFARTTSSLLKTDIMIVNAFKITADVVGNVHYRKTILEISEQIKKGGQINEVIKKYPNFFPPMVAQIIAVGEQTGEVSEILGDLATFYEDDMEQIMQNIPSIIEPILIVLLGVGVGAIAIAVIMPMYSLTNAI